MVRHYDLHSLRLFQLRRFRQGASQRCHSFLPRASMSPCHKMFRFTPRFAPDFPWLRRLYHVAVQSRLLFSLKPSGLATSQQQLGDVMRSFIETCLRHDQISSLAILNHANQESGQKHLDLLASYIPDIWQWVSKKARSEQTSSSFGHKKHKLCTPCKGMRAIPIYKCIAIILRPPAREHQMKSAAMPQSFLRNPSKHVNSRFLGHQGGWLQ